MKNKMAENKNGVGKLPSDADKAPLLGSWTAWYVLLVVWLLISIGALYLFTKHFS